MLICCPGEHGHRDRQAVEDCPVSDVGRVEELKERREDVLDEMAKKSCW